MLRLADGSYADRVAISAGAGLVTDKTGKYTFDLGSLASKPTYDADNNQISLTYGPDQNGRYIRQQSFWSAGNRWEGDSAWTVVDADGNEVKE